MIILLSKYLLQYLSVSLLITNLIGLNILTKLNHEIMLGHFVLLVSIPIPDGNVRKGI